MPDLKSTILVIGPTPPPYNGMSVVMENFLNGFDSLSGFKIVPLDIADRRGLSNIGRFDWGNVFLAMKHGILFLWKVFVKQPDIIYLSIAQGVLGVLRDCLFMIPARFLGIHLVIHLHGSDFRRFFNDDAPGWLRFLLRWVFKRKTDVIVLSPSLRAIFWGLVPEDRIHVVPNGISDLASFFTDVQRSGFTVAYLGTLMKAKGFMEFIKSVPIVIQKEPRARFVLAGEARFSDEIKDAMDFINDQGIGEYIKFPGLVIKEQKVHLLQSASVFVFPPIMPEGQPLVILEAMAAGLSVIATAQGSIKETILDGVNGFIVPPNDPQV